MKLIGLLPETVQDHQKHTKHMLYICISKDDYHIKEGWDQIIIQNILLK